MNELFHMIQSRHIMIVVLCLATLMILFTLHRRSASHTSRFTIDDLLLGDDGKASKAAAVLFGSFALTTWTIVYLTLTEKLTEGYFSAYILAWVAPTVAVIIKGQAPLSRTSTTVTAETTEVTK